ncbi:MAG: hypothetical protein ABR543_19070 [Gemmatimonadaceae bacterium]
MRLARILPLATIVGVLAAVACKGDKTEVPPPGGASQSDTTPRATPAPPFAGRADEVSRAEVLSYVSQLQFDSLPEAADTITISTGNLARIEPEIGSRALLRDSLKLGRIVARITVQSAYPFMGLTQGVNYYWFDSTSTGWRCLMIPADTTLPISTKQCDLSNHGRSISGRSRAHFVRVNPVYASTDCNAGCCVSPKASSGAAAEVDAAFRELHEESPSSR